MAGIIGNAPSSAKSKINYLQTNNLENLVRVKRWNVNKLQNKGNYLHIYISHSTWQNISFQHDTKNAQEFKNSLVSTLNTFNIDEFGSAVTQSNRSIMIEIIVSKYDEINNFFLKK
ncbi:hypothetical protein [Spiroplasma endosymbiont of Agriotes lineatus]|uniref:hypothetical protein n=1 Tax=Spiroplasma endosymbiont of Agriotes lineatus TaxID=3077930 RepID=UPI0030D07155